MRKFYKQAEAGTAPGGYVVRLDGKILKTPLKNNLILPHQDVADMIAAEWVAQGKDILPDTMPMTQLVNTWADKAQGIARKELEPETIKFAGSDLVCYFATHPADLLERQEKSWKAILEKLQTRHGVSLKTVQGIQYIEQAPSDLKLLRGVMEGLDPASFTVLQAATPILGSFVIALAIVEGDITAEEAYIASCVDEIYQLEKWGEDEIARKRLNKIKAEIDVFVCFLNAFKANS